MAVILEFWFNELELMIVGELPEIQCSYIMGVDNFFVVGGGGGGGGGGLLLPRPIL